MKKLWTCGITFILGIFILAGGYAIQAGEQGMHMKDEEHQGMAMESIELDGYRIDYNFMTMMEHHNMMRDMKMDMSNMKMDSKASHHLSIKISDAEGGKSIEDANVKVKVIGPEDKAEEMRAKWSKNMGHYGCDLKIKNRGKYGVIVLFKTDDDKKHVAKFWHELK